MRKCLKEANGPEVKVKYYVLIGQAAYDIVEFAKDYQSDMIILATHGLTGNEHLHQGIVSEKVVRMAECQVFTVKVFGKSYPGLLVSGTDLYIFKFRRYRNRSFI